MKITNVKVNSTIKVWRAGSPPCTREVLEANGRFVKVRVGNKVYASTDEGYINSGVDQVAMTLNAVLSHVLGEEYSGYVHNYEFTNGIVSFAVRSTGPFCG